MKRANCIVQEGMFSNPEIKRIEAGLKEIYQNNYSQEGLNVTWMIMPKGYAYSERQLSEAVIILIEVDEDIEQGKREELMSLFSQFLLSNFKISPLDSVISVANSSFINQFAAAQQSRIHPSARKWTRLKMIFTALTSKWTKGYLRLRVRY